MKQPLDFKTKPEFYSKLKPMSRVDKLTYLVIAFGLLGLGCLIYFNLDSRVV